MSEGGFGPSFACPESSYTKVKKGNKGSSNKKSGCGASKQITRSFSSSSSDSLGNKRSLLIDLLRNMEYDPSINSYIANEKTKKSTYVFCNWGVTKE